MIMMVMKVFMSNTEVGSMTTIKKGLLTHSGEWAKHLRKFWKREFWKSERKAGKELIRKEIKDES
jgi:hypothetical protein